VFSMTCRAETLSLDFVIDLKTTTATRRFVVARVSSNRKTPMTRPGPRSEGGNGTAKKVEVVFEAFEEGTAIEANAAVAENAFKHEVNLAEFPIAALTARVPDGQTPLVFEDRLDQKDGPPIVRRLTIMAPSKHGLPAAVDDEVIVGLIQLT